MNYLKTLLLSLFAIFMPIKAMIITVVVLTLMDLFFGIWAALRQKLPITSSELKRTPIKLMIYLTSLMSGYAVQTYLIGDIIPISNIISTLVGITEMKSLLESMDLIYGEPMFAALIKKLMDTKT